MAISWGAWEGSGSNTMRIGIDVSWSDPGHGASGVTATIKVYLDVTGNWGDTQTITMTGSGSGSTTFSNNQNNNSVLRYTDSYTYSYPSNSYGGTGLTRTFGASLSGAYNGASPSKSVTVTVPGRPFAAPNPPTNVNTARISDSSAKTTWTNKDTAGEPWATVRIQVDVAANDAWNGDAGTTGGGGTSFTDSGLSSNTAYRWRVRSENGEGNSSWVEGDLIYTTPAAPTNAVRTGNNGANQVITWNNNVNQYVDHRIQVQRSDNGGAWADVSGDLARNSTTWTDTYPASNPSIKFKYRVRARTNGGAQGTLYSAYSTETDETAGVTTPPYAPTNLAPANLAIINPKQARTFTWQFNSSDTSAQTQYQFAWRVQGAGSFTSDTAVSSSAAAYTAPIGKFADNTTYEWMVATRAANATWGPYSPVATFKTVGDPNALREQKRVMRMNLETGQPETATVGVLPPIGSITMFGGVAAPAGWLLCQGQVVLRSAYPELFGVIGTAYGAGDGSTTFVLPNMAASFPMGATHAGTPGASPSGTARPLGEVGGADQRTLTKGNIPPHVHSISHTHTVNRRNSTGSGGGVAYGGGTTAADIETSNTSIVGNISGDGDVGSGGAAAAFWTMPQYVVVNYIIKA